MIMTTLRKVLSRRKILFAGGLVLLIGMAIGFEGVYAGPHITINVYEGDNPREILIAEGDGIELVSFVVHCEGGKFAWFRSDEYTQFPRWEDYSPGAKYNIDELMLKPGTSILYSFKCTKSKSRPEIE